MVLIKLKTKIKSWSGIKNPKFKPIYKNMDEKGYILTYVVRHNKYTSEHNTLREARVMAIII